MEVRDEFYFYFLCSLKKMRINCQVLLFSLRCVFVVLFVVVPCGGGGGGCKMVIMWVQGFFLRDRNKFMYSFMAGEKLRSEEKSEKQELLEGMRMGRHDKGEVRVRGGRRRGNRNSSTLEGRRRIEVRGRLMG